ncbi:hypothetical protein PtB15_2B802 [Puccinia triticina]|nr:hypothetical protein PtB15_2B802 [Puccinia triticina]
MDPPLFNPESSPFSSDPSTPDRFSPILPPFGIDSIIGIDSNSSIIPRPEINSIIPDLSPISGCLVDSSDSKNAAKAPAARFKTLEALQTNFAKQEKQTNQATQDAQSLPKS